MNGTSLEEAKQFFVASEVYMWVAYAVKIGFTSTVLLIIFWVWPKVPGIWFGVVFHAASLSSFLRFAKVSINCLKDASLSALICSNNCLLVL